VTKKSQVAAIVGGTVGGVVGAAALGVGAFFFIKKFLSKKITPDKSNEENLEEGKPEESSQVEPVETN
jgi:hypothetical protein